MGEDTNATGETQPFDFDTTHPIVPPSASGTGGVVALKIRSLLTILPAGYTGEGAKSPAADDVSQGAQQTSNLTPGLQYIPTSYTLSHGQVQGTPNIVITADAASPAVLGQYATYVTSTATASDVGQALAGTTATVANGDLMEYIGDANNNPAGAAVYDVTQGRAIQGQYNYVAFSYNSLSGKISFSNTAVPALNSASVLSGNADPTNFYNGTNYNLWWATDISASAIYSEIYDGVTQDVVLPLDDPKLFSPNPFYPSTTSTGKWVTPMMNVVVNSERVRGPDQTQSPSTLTSANAMNLPLVSYTRVPFGTTIGKNQYSIEYRHPVTPASSGAPAFSPWIHLGQITAWQTLLQLGQSSAASGQFCAASTIMVAYNVQNNTQTMANGLPTPASISVSYATSNTMRVTLGLRVYDTFSGTARFHSVSSDVPVGNGIR